MYAVLVYHFQINLKIHESLDFEFPVLPVSHRRDILEKRTYSELFNLFHWCSCLICNKAFSTFLFDHTWMISQYHYCSYRLGFSWMNLFLSMGFWLMLQSCMVLDNPWCTWNNNGGWHSYWVYYCMTQVLPFVTLTILICVLLDACLEVSSNS